MLTINETECVGCGACVSVCPAGFELIGEKASVKDKTAACVEDAVKACPRGAIVWLTQRQVPQQQPVISSSLQAGPARGPGGIGGGAAFSPGRRRRGRQKGSGRRRGRS